MFNFLARFRRRGYEYMRSRLLGIRGKWGEEYGWLASLEARLNALWAWVTGIWAAISAWWAGIWAAFQAWVTPLVNWLQVKVAWLLGIYNSYIKPVLDWVNETVKWLRGIVLLIQGKLDDLVKYVYTNVFGWLEDLRKSIKEIFDTVENVASIFSEKLATNIQSLENKFFALLDSFSRDIRDWALTTISNITEPVIHKTNEIILLLEGYIKKAEDHFNQIEDFIAKTFEKPKLLRKDTVEVTAKKYGQELWEGMFKALEPEVGPGESRPFPFERLPEWLEMTRENINKGAAGNWADVVKRIDEEIQEITVGEEVEKKTELSLPGAGGSW